MSIPPSISLNSSLTGPTARHNLRILTQTVAETGERQATLKVAKVYADVSQQAWDLQGVFSNLQTADHLQKFYKQQTLFLKTYSATLEGIRQTLKDFVGQAYDATSLIPGSFEAVKIVKDGMRHTLESLVNLLSAYDANYGYLFSGAQVDQKSINPQLIPDMIDPFGPNLSLGTLKDYFLNGNTPKAQSPLILYANGQEVCTVPLQANDFQYAIETIYQFLSLSSNPSTEEVQYFTQAMAQPLDLVEEGFTRIAGYLKTFEQNEQILESVSAAYASWRDEQLEVDPMEAAMAFEESSRALQAFLSYLVFMVSSSQKFHELTNSVML